jgi:hypothetical protein
MTLFVVTITRPSRDSHRWQVSPRLETNSKPHKKWSDPQNNRFEGTLALLKQAQKEYGDNCPLEQPQAKAKLTGLNC